MTDQEQKFRLFQEYLRLWFLRGTISPGTPEETEATRRSIVRREADLGPAGVEEVRQEWRTIEQKTQTAKPWEPPEETVP